MHVWHLKAPTCAQIMHIYSWALPGNLYTTPSTITYKNLSCSNFGPFVTTFVLVYTITHSKMAIKYKFVQFVQEPAENDPKFRQLQLLLKILTCHSRWCHTDMHMACKLCVGGAWVNPHIISTYTEWLLHAMLFQPQWYNEIFVVLGIYTCTLPAYIKFVCTAHIYIYMHATELSTSYIIHAHQGGYICIGK